MNNLFLIAGVPGSGKSTFIQEWKPYENSYQFNSSIHPIWISRDLIRFNLIPNINQDNYFSNESEVFNLFIRRINIFLNKDDVFADATHLTPFAREKTLIRITTPAILNCIWFDIPLDVCLERNEKRKDTIAYVPPNTIRNMYKRWMPPTFKEGFKNIYRVNADGSIIKYKKK